MNSRLLITLLCAGAVALACGSLANKSSSAAQSRKSTRLLRSAATSTSIAGVNGNFAVKVEAHSLQFALDLTNDNKKHVELTFPNGQEYEFTVLDTAGREVYRWGASRMFTQSVQNRLLNGGDTMHISERTKMALPVGKYVAVATLRSSNFPITQSSEFELR